MAYISAGAKIYDPAIPFKLVVAPDAIIDSWHTDVLITKGMLDYLPQVREIEKGDLQVPGGMSIIVPVVEIGIQIGTIKVDRVKALVVDSGHHDLVIGSDILNSIFNVGRPVSDQVRVVSTEKEDADALALELFPVTTPVDLRFFEKVIKNQRHLHNIALICLGKVAVNSAIDIDTVLENDMGVPPSFRLKLAWIDTGSIWITLTSGSEKALKYLASLFETGTSAKLAQQIADAKRAENEAEISQSTRDATAARIIQEQERFKAENLSATYEAWRNEVRARLNLFDDLIAQVSSPDIAEQLKFKKDEAILELIDQEILPLVRNIPGSYQSVQGSQEETKLLLPPSSTDFFSE